MAEHSTAGGSQHGPPSAGRSTAGASATATADLLIIGGGVVGLSIAWKMAQLGRQVVVLDSHQIVGGASWAGAGILPPVPRRGAVDPYEQLRMLSHGLHVEWAGRLKESTGIDTQLRRCGGIYLATTGAEQATLLANQYWWDEHGIEYQCWSAEQLAEHEPELAEEHQVPLRGMWFLPDEYQLRNPRHLKALRAACRQLQVKLWDTQPVERVESDDSGEVNVLTKHYRWRANQVCLCSGAWARHSLEQLGIETGIMPIRGQILLYRDPRPRLRHIVNEGNRYLVPRLDGRLLVGSVEEEVGYTVKTTEVVLDQLREWAEGFLPGLKTTTLEKSWAGLRPGSFDSLPYLGAVPGMKGLFVAAGHFRSGLHLSCATAEVMSQVMQGDRPSIDLHPFRVGRG